MDRYRPQRGGYSQYSDNYGGYRGGGRGEWGRRGRGYRGRGRGAPGGAPFPDPEDIKFLKVLKGHTKQITAAVIDKATGQIYTGSQDGTVRIWSLDTGQCVDTIPVQGSVDSMLLEAPYLFVGMHATTPDKTGVVRVWNLQTKSEQTLPGHKGDIYGLAAAQGLLFTCGQDTTIKVWRFDEATQQFQPMVELGQQQGGHSAQVQCVTTCTPFLYSGDWQGNIKVWDMSSGTCTQTISKGHSTVVMGLVSWEGHLLSASLDGTIKVWQPVESPVPGSVLAPQPSYSHPPEDAAPGAKKAAPEFGPILAVAGTTDAHSKPVILASHLDENIIRMWELPSFAERGQLSAVKDARALATIIGSYIASGDKHGNLKLWQWRAT